MNEPGNMPGARGEVPDRSRLVVTTCSARKSASAQLSAADLEPGSMEQVASDWDKAVRGTSTLVPAGRLYAGRGFGIARDAADKLKADLGILSAGLGFLRAGTMVPSYDLTLSAMSPANPARAVIGPFSSVEWWRTLGRGPCASDFVAEALRYDEVLVCLSAPYARMIAEDLQAVAVGRPGTLRIFGRSLSSVLPSSLAQYVMPYDDRLNSVGRRGASFDFAQRALGHFVSLGPANTDSASAAAAVRESLAAVESRPAINRMRRGDDAIVAIIAEAIASGVTPTSAALFGELRGRAVACGQERFRRLLRQALDRIAA